MRLTAIKCLKFICSEAVLIDTHSLWSYKEQSKKVPQLLLYDARTKQRTPLFYYMILSYFLLIEKWVYSLNEYQKSTTKAVLWLNLFHVFAFAVAACVLDDEVNTMHDS